MTNDERIFALSVLRKAEWLEGFDPLLADTLMSHGRLTRIARGGWAQGEGDEDRGLFVVIAGLFHTYCTAPGDRDVMIGQAGTGSVLGHATRFSGGPRLVTAICIEPALLLQIPETALEQIAERQPDIWRMIANSAYANLRRAMQMMVEAITLPPRPRIAARLLAMALPHSLAGMVPQVASPIRLSKTPVEYRSAPPLLGEHTERVLQDVLGLGAANVASLRELGVI